jgi:hypothetical protein
MFYGKQIMNLFIVNISLTVTLFFTGIHWFKAKDIWLSPLQSLAPRHVSGVGWGSEILLENVQL